VYDNMKLNINPDYSNNPGEYIYTIIYKNVTYKGKIIVEDIEEVEKETNPITVIEEIQTSSSETIDNTNEIKN
ncbi:MAG: hypothetical protein IKE70_00630, partial [Bacilli bacterium]|nr:hypothetical protein [Bacilli bacterium]